MSKTPDLLQSFLDREVRDRTGEHLQTVLRRIAHEIRSPLAALSTALEYSPELREGKRALIRAALERLQELALQLSPPRELRDETSARLLSPLIDTWLSEKRSLLRGLTPLTLEKDPEGAAFGLFTPGPISRIRQALDTVFEALLDHSFEASALRVQWVGLKDVLEVCFVLTGLREWKVPQLDPDRIDALAAWGASIQELDGKAGLSLRLPRAHCPRWFASELSLGSGSSLVVLDDDASVHQLWEDRYASLGLKSECISLLHFFDADSFRGWARHANRQESRFLIDHDLGTGPSGLDLVEELGLCGRSILVTTRFDDPEVLRRCERLSVKCLPKTIAGFVPLVFEQGEWFDAVLIDDDPLVRRLWRASAEAENLNLLTFAKPAEFRGLAPRIQRGVPVYVDSNLGNEICGEDFSKEIRALGFREIYLATGRNPDDVGAVPWINAVVGKEPPFGILR